MECTEHRGEAFDPAGTGDAGPISPCTNMPKHLTPGRAAFSSSGSTLFFPYSLMPRVKHGKSASAAGGPGARAA